MTEPILSVRGVDVRYPRTSAPAVRDVDLTVTVGSAIGIVGESGSGKTTLARALVGLVRPTAGRIEVAGRAWSSVRRKDPMRRQVQMVFQDPYAALNPHLTARAAIAEVLRVWHDLGRRDAAMRAGNLLEEVGLASDTFDRLPAGLSGGQCQRVGIARALACEPSVLVADEPTSALDVSVQAQILNLLADLRSSHGLALVLISHDLGVVRYATQEALVMHRGEVVERGHTAELLDAPTHPYTRTLIESVPGRLTPLIEETR